MSSLSLGMNIFVFGFLMSAISLIGGLTICFSQARLQRFMSLFIALASGTLVGGALFHMVPHVLEKGIEPLWVMGLVCVGFSVLYASELLVHWHHCRSDGLTQQHVKPQGYMILIADGLHNFVGGVGIGAGFLLDPALGLSMWFAAVMHEIPQEVGDFAVLINSGWSRWQALSFNFISSLTFPLGMFLAWGLGAEIELIYLVPFTAGTFLYIAASDLIPEVKEHPKFTHAILHFLAFALGLLALVLPSVLFHGHA